MAKQDDEAIEMLEALRLFNVYMETVAEKETGAVRTVTKVIYYVGHGIHESLSLMADRE